MEPSPEYFVSTITKELPRRAGGSHTAFYGGEWRPTNTILAWMIGEEDNVEPVTEEAARASRPAAFS